MRRPLLALLFAAGLAACGSHAALAPLDVPEGCQPIEVNGPKPRTECFLPYPSDFFRVADPSMPSGFRIEVPQAAKLRTTGGTSSDSNEWRPADGASRATTIVGFLPDDVVRDGLVNVRDDPTPTLSPSSATILLDADTLTPVPHFVDVDPRGTNDRRRAIVLYPLAPLREQARYIVAFAGVKTKEGRLAKAPEGFRRLRDRGTASDPSLQAIQARYDAGVFAPLARFGVPRSRLQLAWDFTTRSDARVEDDLTDVRAKTLVWLGGHVPAVTVDSVSEETGTNVWRVVRGHIEGPLFTDQPDIGAVLHRGPDGRPDVNGTVKFEFLAVVPASVRDMSGPGRALAYGHGFFGTKDEANGGSARHVFDRLGATGIAIDWWGMSNADVGGVLGDFAGAPWRVMRFTDRVHQAMANWIVTAAAIEGPLKQVPALQRADGSPLWGDAPLDYLGISQGSILGTTMTAVNPYFERIGLQVGGGPFTQMMFRAEPFGPFLAIVGQGTPDFLDQRALCAQTQPQFDRIDPAAWAHHLVTDPLPGTPEDRRVLMQAGIGDHEVPNLGTYFVARAAALPLAWPSVRDLYGLDHAGLPLAGSALMMYDLGVDDSFYDTPVPATVATPVHEGLRKMEQVLSQLDAFYQPDSQIIDPCGGPCRLPPPG